MADKPVPGSYIDTQGMGAPLSEEERNKLPKQEYIQKWNSFYNI